MAWGALAGNAAKKLVSLRVFNTDVVFSSNNKGATFDKTLGSFGVGSFTYSRPPIAVIDGLVYISNQLGQVFTTSDFVSFTQITVASIELNGGSTVFGYGVGFYYDGADLFALADVAGNTDFNLYKSSDLGLNWTILARCMFFGILEVYDAIIGDNYFCIPINSTNNTAYALIHKTTYNVTFVLTSSHTDLRDATGSGFYSNGFFYFPSQDRITIVNDTTGQFSRSSNMPKSPVNSCAKGINSNRIVAATQTSDGVVRVYYSDNDAVTWSVATIPFIAFGATVAVPLCIAALDGGGFAMSYGAPSVLEGIIYSADGITWANATINNSSFFYPPYALYNNPL